MQAMQSLPPIFLAAGGTGGHVFPAETLAEELAMRGEKVILITDKRFLKNISTENIAAIHTIASSRISGGVPGRIKAMFMVIVGIIQAMKLILKHKPRAVVGFGGYPSFPSMIAAAILGIPTIIHEQNAVLGRANRWLIRHVDVVATSFERTMMIDETLEYKLVITGNPVRGSIRALAHLPYPEMHGDSGIHLLVIGGSQGAAIFSQIIPAAIASLPANIRKRMRIDQQCRAEDVEVVQAAYSHLGVSVNVSPFFTDIPLKLASAHLVISRAGASSLNELAVAGRPAIFVPLPTAMDDHQTMNARAFEDAGAGWVMAQEAFTAKTLSARLEAFMGAPNALADAARKAQSLGKIHAAEQLADVVLKAAGHA